MPYAIISPVGTSFLLNVYGRAEADAVRKGLRKEYEALGRSAEAWLRQFEAKYIPPNGTWAEAFTRLTPVQTEAQLRPNSAEANSILMFRDSRPNDRLERLYLLPTDTAESMLCAKALARHFHKLLETEIVVRPVGKMDYARPAEFEREGLRSLLSALTSCIKEARDRQLDPVLNGTPGFKAETALSLLLAQLLGVPVFYLHEAMNGRVISLPSIPLTVTPEFWDRWGSLVLDVGNFSQEEQGCMPADQFKRLTRYTGFVEADILFENFDGGITLSGVGWLLYEAHESKIAALPKSVVTVPDKLKITTKEQQHVNARPTIETQLSRIAKLAFVNYIRPFSTPYAAATTVSKKFDAAQPDEVIVTLTDGSYGLKVRISTTARDEPEWRAACQGIDAAICHEAGKVDAEAGTVKSIYDTYSDVADLARAKAVADHELERAQSALAAKNRDHQEQVVHLQRELQKERTNAAQNLNRAKNLERKINRLDAEVRRLRDEAAPREPESKAAGRSS